MASKAIILLFHCLVTKNFTKFYTYVARNKPDAFHSEVSISQLIYSELGKIYFTCKYGTICFVFRNFIFVTRDEDAGFITFQLFEDIGYRYLFIIKWKNSSHKPSLLRSSFSNILNAEY